MTDEVKELREAARAVLERRYGHLTVVKGQGVQRGSRVSFEKDGKTCICAIKASTLPAGRVHFPYSDGTWGALAEVDFVLYVRRHKDGIEYQFHCQNTLLKAFNANREAAEKGGFTNLPVWLSPDPEHADRYVGSGFGKFAVWTEVTEPVSGASSEIRPLSVAEMIEKTKVSLAGDLGVNPTAIEIHVRW